MSATTASTEEQRAAWRRWARTSPALQVRLSPDAHRHLARAAERRGVTVSELVRVALAEFTAADK